MYENLLDGTTWRIEDRQRHARESFRHAGGRPARRRTFARLHRAAHVLRHG